MLLSRTPQPAIDIGMVETNKTGGMSKRTCAKLIGAATALVQHHAAMMVSKWITIEQAMITTIEGAELHSVIAAREAADRCRVNIHRSKNCRYRMPMTKNKNVPATTPNPMASKTARAIGSRMSSNVQGRQAITSDASANTPTIRSINTE